MAQKHTIARELSLEAQILYRRLIAADVGEVIPYAELTELIGIDVQGQNGRGYLRTARRRALDLDSMVFGVVRNHGVKRLTAPETILKGDSMLRHIGRSTKTGIKDLITVEPNGNLTDEQKIHLNRNLSALGVLKFMTEGRTIKKIETAVSRTIGRDQLTWAKTLEIFKEK